MGWRQGSMKMALFALNQAKLVADKTRRKKKTGNFFISNLNFFFGWTF